MDKKNRITILFVIGFISIIIGTTFSWLNYRSTDTALVLKIGNVSGMVVTVKPYIINSSLTLTNNYQNDGKLIDVTVTNNHPSRPQIFTLYFDIDSIDSVLNTSPTSDYFKYIVLKSTTGNANSYTETVASGDFTGANTNDNFIIYSESVATNTTYYYKVYIYLERDMNTDQSALQNKTFKAEFRARISGYIDPSGANAPELTSGMVPVKLNENGTVVTTVDPVSSNDWYNYSQQKWANAVLVDSSVRSNYIDSTTGAIIPNVNVDTSKILAYYVWIPRYKYTFVDNSTQNPYPVQSIDIVFEGKNDPRATGGANGPNDYYTHPAFTWNFTGDTLDESTPNLGGIWVGKFEMNYNSSGTFYSSTSIGCTNTTCANANKLRILPYKRSLGSNTVSSFFYGIRSMQQSNNLFGLPTSIIIADSHMIKNREWGAVAYLSHSAYGLGNQEVRMNYYVSDGIYVTGCGASAANPPSSNRSTCYDYYGKTTTTSPSTTGDISTYPQSTNGNITGVFDMSGGIYEYVMGNFRDTIASTGFSSLPASKYYDKYTVSDYSSCTFVECGGHALKETSSWHGDSSGFVYSTNSWFERGGSVTYVSSTDSMGLFNSSVGVGDSVSWKSTRAVVVVN